MKKNNSFMNTYIVTQIVVESVKPKIDLITVMRIVYASSEAEAIGKFILDTSSIEGVQKLSVLCSRLQEIPSIL